MRYKGIRLCGGACAAAAIALQASAAYRVQAQTSRPALPATGKMESAVAQSTEPVMRITAADNQFGLRLFAELEKNGEDANLCVSPTSVAQALQMVYGGAAGSTRAGMAQALALEDMTTETIDQGNKALLASLTGGDTAARKPGSTALAPAGKPLLAIAISLWIAKTAAMRPEFVKRTRTCYNAEVGSLRGAPQNINTWVDGHTRGKIKQIVSAEDVRRAEAVLVNAVYFKGLWSTPFPAEKTVDKPFHMGIRSQTTCKMMAQSGRFAYMQNHLFQMVSLPYQGNRLEMRLVLPKEGTSVSALAAQFTPETWQQATRKMISTPGEVELPRFRAEFGITLNRTLASLGMGVAFGDTADFSAMSKQNLYISKVIHKTFIEVDERGTEAAAATAVVMKGRGVMAAASPFSMVMDRPFLYALCDRQTGALLFLGALNRPGSSS